MQGTHQNLHNICKPDISQLKRIIRRIQLIQEQITYLDKVFKIGVDVFWTNRHDLRYGAKKNCNGPMKICTIFAKHGHFRLYDLMDTFKHLYRIF